MKITLLLGLYVCSISTTFAADLYTCPELAFTNGYKKIALKISLYSGNPAEMAVLKPDNGDSKVMEPPYWSMGSSKYDYWYVCEYKNSKLKKEFKLNKNYHVCTNSGKANYFNQLKCK